MHEVELGVFKAIFKHLLRVLYAVKVDSIQRLNARYAQAPTVEPRKSRVTA